MAWFLPFLQGWLGHPTLDPWSAHLSAGGDALSFPYGPVMFAAYLPGVAMGAGLDALFGVEGLFTHIGFACVTLLFDYGVLRLLQIRFADFEQRIIWLYWLSPITLYVGYWYGQTDIVPVFLLTACLITLNRLRLGRSGGWLGLAAAAKLSMLAAAPFIAIYLWKNKRLRPIAHSFIRYFVYAFGLLQLPWLFTEGTQVMMLANREMAKLYQMRLSMGEGIYLYWAPLAYLAILYAVWRLGRFNFDLLAAAIGGGFMVLLVLTPASVGWYYWTLPFLVIHQLRAGLTGMILVGGFSLLFLLLAPATSPGANLALLGWDLSHTDVTLRAALPERWLSLLQTGLTASALLLCWQMYRVGITGNDYFRLSRQPLLLGIAGDSGSGKDSLAHAIGGLFGEASVVNVSGDDYHLWDRYAPMWKALTHLNPRANNLMAFCGDVLKLLDGQPIRCRHYDHASGRFTAPQPVADNDVIIASGLHALYTPALRQRCDVRIFLDMDADLRRYFKIRRDVTQRGKGLEETLADIARREPDAAQYVRPQMAHAQLVFTLQAARPEDVRLPEQSAPQGSGRRKKLPLKLRALLRDTLYHEDLARILIAICGLYIDVAVVEDGAAVEMRVEGDVESEDLALAAKMLAPHMEEMLSLWPNWQAGMAGVMQLIVLLHAAQALAERR
ncbi:putative Phosphoribulokinase/uridine kinase [Magnetofaba australis IT-1]|uniref:phosphoribulokinase n=1 Tax=Magnetofaba australis IT-1 TaxID=1434232 RepID=A0A1Y2K3S9_9PROT|nr:putative Phosphoribulokinase/uridine kinase [Magnetofaba australis IT-1]